LQAAVSSKSRFTAAKLRVKELVNEEAPVETGADLPKLTAYEKTYQSKNLH